MLTVKGKVIIVSHGDSLALTFKTPDYAFKADDQVLFAIKQNVYDSAPILEKPCSCKDNICRISVPAIEMAQIEVGNYYWDLSVIKADGTRYTFNYANLIRIMGVAHNAK